MQLGWNSQPTRAVFFTDCKVPVENLVGSEGEGFKIAMKALDGGRVNIGLYFSSISSPSLPFTVSLIGNRSCDCICSCLQRRRSASMHGIIARPSSRPKTIWLSTCQFSGFELFFILDFLENFIHILSCFSESQHLQFKYADMATQMTTSRLLVRTAADKIDKQDPCLAKRFDTDNCFDVCNDALQMFGGYGYLKDYPVQRYLH